MEEERLENSEVKIEEKQEKPKKKDLEKKLEKKEEELAEAREKILRVAAEFDNYKKRTSRELSCNFTIARCDTVKNILPVIDNFDRALEIEVSQECVSYKEGVDLIYKQLMEILKGMGLEEIEAKGKDFDPNLHNAVMHTEDENARANEIVEVFQKGYKIEDRVLRHSMVKVAN